MSWPIQHAIVIGVNLKESAEMVSISQSFPNYFLRGHLVATVGAKEAAMRKNTPEPELQDQPRDRLKMFRWSGPAFGGSDTNPL